MMSKIKNCAIKLIGITYMLLVIACGKDTKKPEAILNSTNVALKHKETFQFEVTRGNEQVPFSTLTSSSSDDFVGSLSSSGLFTANSIGETTIKIVGEGISLSAKVTVEPIYNLYREPSLNFSHSKAQIKSYETRSLDGETAGALLYKGENNNLDYVMYIFENGVLNGAAVLFPPRSSLVEQVTAFYNERYNYLGQTSGRLVFDTPKSSVMVVIGVDSDLGFNAMYLDGTGVRAQGIKAELEPNHEMGTKEIADLAKTLLPLEV